MRLLFGRQQKPTPIAFIAAVHYWQPAYVFARRCAAVAICGFLRPARGLRHPSVLQSCNTLQVEAKCCMCCAPAQLWLSVYEAGEARGPALAGGTCMPLFNKRGRLKTGPQRLRVWEATPPGPATPGKLPLAQVRRLLVYCCARSEYNASIESAREVALDAQVRCPLVCTSVYCCGTTSRCAVGGAQSPCACMQATGRMVF